MSRAAPPRHVMGIATLSDSIAQRVFPASCALCGTRGLALCKPCRDETMATLASACSQCALPLRSHDAARICGACLRRAPRFDATIAAAAYDAPFDSLVRALKYRAQLSFVPLLAELVAARIAQTNPGEAIDVLIPVPLSRERLGARGFNQALEIARPLAKKLGIAIDAASVLRIRDTPPQASLPYDERRKNMRDAFALREARRTTLKGLCVGVVDDVMTTGATLNEFAATLKRAGAARVVNLVLARTP